MFQERCSSTGNNFPRCLRYPSPQSPRPMMYAKAPHTRCSVQAPARRSIDDDESALFVKAFFSPRAARRECDSIRHSSRTVSLTSPICQFQAFLSTRPSSLWPWRASCPSSSPSNQGALDCSPYCLLWNHTTVDSGCLYREPATYCT